jgi:hypothetical protein
MAKQAMPRGSGSHELAPIAEVETVDPEPVPSESLLFPSRFLLCSR